MEIFYLYLLFCTICSDTGAGEGSDLIYDLRLSETVFIDDGESELVDRLSHRMNWITGLHTAALLDTEGREEEDYELLQLASYGSGGFYKLHLVGPAGSNSHHISHIRQGLLC